MMNQSLTLAEILASLRPLFERAMTATDDGAVTQPERAKSLHDAWAALVTATETKYSGGPRPLGVLNADLAHRYDIDRGDSEHDSDTAVTPASADVLQPVIDGISREFGDAVKKLRSTGADPLQDAYIDGLQRALQIAETAHDARP